MKLVPALEYEKLRDDANINKIILHKDGKFYHIYEWSAWLVKTVVCTEEYQSQRGDAKILAANRYNSENGEYVMAGFPLESVSKYIPQYDTLEEMEGGDLQVSVPLSPEMAMMTFDEMRKAFDEWKAEQPFKEGRNVKSVQQITNGDPRPGVLARSGVFQIMAEVIAYPIEASTPAQNVEFLSKIKQKLIALL